MFQKITLEPVNEGQIIQEAQVAQVTVAIWRCACCGMPLRREMRLDQAKAQQTCPCGAIQTIRRFGPGVRVRCEAAALNPDQKAWLKANICLSVGAHVRSTASPFCIVCGQDTRPYINLVKIREE